MVQSSRREDAKSAHDIQNLRAQSDVSLDVERLSEAKQPKSTFRTEDLVGLPDASRKIDFYKPIDTHESAHRYDPDFRWTRGEERALVKRLDFRICAYVCLMFFALQLDRGNIVQAVSDNMIPQLKMNTNDYNTGQTIFFLSFLCAELPSQIISKRIGPDRWIPIQMVSWSLVASMQAFLSGKGSFYVTRALLGLIEGGFIPDTILYLSYWYTTEELPTRLSFFWTAYQGTYIISAFLAFGILHLDGVNGFAGWRWLFALEGCLTGFIGIFTYFYLPPSPTQTASTFRGKHGWFTEKEEKILVNRILRDDPSKGDMHNRQGLSLGMLWKCLKDYDMWPLYLIGLTFELFRIPFSSYITLLLKSDGFDTFTTNLLTIPSYTLFIINLLFWTWIARITGQKFLLATISQWWALPCLIALETLPASTGPWPKFVLVTLIMGSPYVHAIHVALTSRNAGSVRTRTVASALYNMAVQASNIIGVNIYRDDDKPLYRRGNKVLIGVAVWTIAAFVLAWLYYRARNEQKRRIWDAMSSAQKAEYLASTKDEGNKRLDFRFAY